VWEPLEATARPEPTATEATESTEANTEVR
jgi:hypothetical protein